MPPPAAEPPRPPAPPPQAERPVQAQPAAPIPSDDLWARALELAPTKQARAMMASLRPVEISEARWVVACDNAPMRKVVEVRLAELADIVREVCPAARLELAGSFVPAGGQPTTATAPPPGPSDEPEIVRLAVELFGARVVNVQRKDRNNGNG